MQRQIGTPMSRTCVVLLVLLIGTSGSVALISSVGESNPFGGLLSALDGLLPRASTSTSGTFHGDVTLEISQTLPGPVPASQTSSEAQTESVGGLSPSTDGPSTPMMNILPSFWTNQSRKRSKFEVYVEILELLKRGPLTPFEVAFYARLNHKRTKEYIGVLEDSGYVSVVNEDGKMLCVLTEPGAGVVEKARAMRGLFSRREHLGRGATPGTSVA